MDTDYLLVDLDKAGPLQDQRVRCALSMALDRQQLSEVTSNGINPPANGLFSPGQQGYLADNGLSMEQDLDGAAALIADYEAATGDDVHFTIGHVPANAVAQGVELMMGWWNEIGIDVDDLAVPQNDFINQAIFGVPEFEVFVWRGHGGHLVDEQHVWWHSKNAFPDGELSLNVGRLRDPDVDAGLDAARASSSDAEAVAAAEDINRVFAEQCYVIPIDWVRWAALGAPNLRGFGDLALPDGTRVLDGPVVQVAPGNSGRRRVPHRASGLNQLLRLVGVPLGLKPISSPTSIPNATNSSGVRNRCPSTRPPASRTASRSGTAHRCSIASTSAELPSGNSSTSAAATASAAVGARRRRTPRARHRPRRPRRRRYRVRPTRRRRRAARPVAHRRGRTRSAPRRRRRREARTRRR